MSTHLKAAVLAIVAVAGLVTHLTVSTLAAARVRPRVGDPWALQTPGPGSEAGRPQHLVVYSPTCKWCNLQLRELRATGADSLGDPIVLLSMGDEAETRAQLRELSLRARIIPIERAELEAAIGTIRTPTHIVVGGDQVVAAYHQGYLAGPELLRLHGAAAERGSAPPPGAAPGEGAPTSPVCTGEPTPSAGTCLDTTARSAP